MNLCAHPVFELPELSALADDVCAATSRLFNHLLVYHPALTEVANRDGFQMFRPLIVRHDYISWDFTLEEDSGDHAHLKVVSRDDAGAK
jgi:sirohydrochlorin ferrochelatase